MRMLFVTWAWPSHLYAMVPLAWACRAAGHEVRIASQPGLGADIRQTGLTGVSVGEDVDTVQLVRGYLLPGPVSREATTTSTAAATTVSGARRTGRGPRALQLLLAHAESMVDDLIRYARGWPPDVVVFEPTALVGPLAAAALDVPAVRHLYGVDLLYPARALLPELLEPLARRCGVRTVDPMGAATIDPVPSSLRLPAVYRRHLPMRFVPFNGPGGCLPARPTDATPRPAEFPARVAARARVCVTWGTTVCRLDPTRFLAGHVVAALQDLDVEIIAAVTPDQRPLLGSVGGNVRIVEGVPLHLTLPGCALLVAHGGAGTILTGLAQGLPQLLIPQLPDHAGHAARVQAAGAGTVLTRSEASPERLRTEVSRLLRGTAERTTEHGDERTTERTTARRLQREMHHLPTPAAVVGELERISHSAGQVASS